MSHCGWTRAGDAPGLLGLGQARPSFQGLGSAGGWGRGQLGSQTPSCSRPTCFPFTAARRPGPHPRAKLAGAGSRAAEEVPRGRDPQPGGFTQWRPAPRGPLRLCPHCVHALGPVNKASRLPSTTCVLAHQWGPRVGRVMRGLLCSLRTQGTQVLTSGSAQETPGCGRLCPREPQVPTGSAGGYRLCPRTITPSPPRVRAHSAGPRPPPRICSEASLGQQSLAFAECPEGRPGAQTSPRNRAEGSLQQRTCTRPQGGGRAHLREQSWQHRPFFLYYMGTECSLCKSERPDQVELRKI